MRTLLLSLSLFALALPAFSQQQVIQRRTNIVFEFPEFQDATVLQPFGATVQAKANIHIKNATLCYMDGDTIKQAYVDRILGVQFNDSVRYMRLMGEQFGRVLYTKGYNELLRVTTLDQTKYNAETRGGDNLPFFEIAELDIWLNIDGDSREETKGYPLTDTYWYLIGGVPVRANETAFKPYVRPEMLKAFEKLMYDHYFSWNDTQCLINLMEYIND